MDQNIKIPLSMFNQIAYVLQHIDTNNCGSDVQRRIDDILTFFFSKKAAMELRHSYSAVINAKDEEERESAKSEYIAQKNRFRRF